MPSQPMPPNTDDLRAVAAWLKAPSVDSLRLRKAERPLSLFFPQIQEMLNSHAFFPQDKRRSLAILGKLKRGEASWPIYIEDGDETHFVLEGRHRLVAFYWAGVEQVSVYFCSQQTVK